MKISKFSPSCMLLFLLASCQASQNDKVASKIKSLSDPIGGSEAVSIYFVNPAEVLKVPETSHLLLWIDDDGDLRSSMDVVSPEFVQKYFRQGPEEKSCNYFEVIILVKTDDLTIFRLAKGINSVIYDYKSAKKVPAPCKIFVVRNDLRANMGI